MSAEFGRKNLYTGLWMNLSLCSSCRKALRKGGKHREHDCDGDYIAGSACVICDCECQAPTTAFVENLKNIQMALI